MAVERKPLFLNDISREEAVALSGTISAPPRSLYAVPLLHQGELAGVLEFASNLRDIEMTIIRNHAEASYDILKKIDFPWPVAEICRQHHERLDGSGCPRGLAGEDILLEARILVIADVMEAMASHRPYRPALGMDKALACC